VSIPFDALLAACMSSSNTSSRPTSVSARSPALGRHDRPLAQPPTPAAAVLPVLSLMQRNESSRSNPSLSYSSAAVPRLSLARPLADADNAP
jgi:hypothetical protein